MITKITQILTCITLMYTAAKNTLKVNDEELGISPHRFLKFNISIYEEKLIRILSPYNFSFISKEYANFPECIQTITKVIQYDSDFMFSYFIEIPALVDSIKLYTKFLADFNTLKDKCITEVKAAIPQIDTAKLTIHTLLNRSIFVKFIQIERSFTNYLDKFLYLVLKDHSVLNTFSIQLKFYKEYIETLYELMFAPLLQLERAKDFNHFIRENEQLFTDIVIVFLESLDILLYKNVVNLFVLIFEETEQSNRVGKGTSQGSNRVNSSRKFVVRKEFGNYEGYNALSVVTKELDSVIGHLFDGIGNITVLKETLKLTDPLNWKADFLKRTITIVKSFTLQLFENTVMFK